jgi:hypothetical protein
MPKLDEQTKRVRMTECLDEMIFENPEQPDEKWFSESYFDPPFLRGTLRACASAKYIELDPAGDEWRFRLTSAGRKAAS